MRRCITGASQVALGIKNLPANAGDIRDASSVPGSGWSLGGERGNPFQYSCLGNPWTEEPGGLQSRGSQRVGHDWSNLAHSASQWEEPELQISSLLLRDRVTFTRSECPHLSVWDAVGARGHTSNLPGSKERASKYTASKYNLLKPMLLTNSCWSCLLIQLIILIVYWICVKPWGRRIFFLI